MQIRAVIWGIIAILLVVAGLAQFVGKSSSQKIQTNLMALLPKTEQSLAAEQALNHLNQLIESRIVLLIGGTSLTTVKTVAWDISNLLKQSSAFKNIQSKVPAVDLSTTLALYSQHRFHLLSDEDRQHLISRFSPSLLEQRVTEKLYRPFKLGAPLAQDPFGFLDRYMATLPLQKTFLTIEDSWLVVRKGNFVYVMVSAELAGSAYDNRLQIQIKDALQTIDTRLQDDPDIKMLHTGTVLFALAARENAQREVDVIGLGSVIGISILLLLLFHSLRPLFLAVLSVGIGICAAIALTIAKNGELHLLTLVFGASLTGEAVDYSIQYFVARVNTDENHWQSIRRILPALSVAVGTSLLGYFALFVLPFPGLNQIAFFSMIGLICAYATVIFLLPVFVKRPLHFKSQALLLAPQQFLSWWRNKVNCRIGIYIISVLLLVSLPGWFYIAFEDDVRLLAHLSKPLLQQDQQIRQLTGISNSSQFFLVEGENVEQLLQREEALTQRLRALQRENRLERYQAISDFVPSIKRQQETYKVFEQSIMRNPKEVMQLLDKFDFKRDAANAYINDFQKSKNDYLLIEEWLKEPVAIPFRALWMGKIENEKNIFASIVLPQGFTSIETMQQLQNDLAGVSFVDKVGKLSQLFAKYRRMGSMGLAVVLLMVYIVLAFRYSPHEAAIILLPTLLAIGLTLSVFGYLGISLTLFNVMALMLVLGVGVNYAIFLYEGSERFATTFVGVVLSAITTLLSFGLLALSSMPALNRFGLTLLLGIGFAVLLTPLVITFTSSRSRFSTWKKE